MKNMELNILKVDLGINHIPKSLKKWLFMNTSKAMSPILTWQ